MLRIKIEERELNEHFEWAYTLMFYELVHSIEAFFAQYGNIIGNPNLHSRNHNQRVKFLEKFRFKNKQIEDYLLIEDFSRSARYEYQKISLDDYEKISKIFKRLQYQIKKTNPLTLQRRNNKK